MHLARFVLIILSLGLYSSGRDLYPNYSLFYDPVKSLEWSNDLTLVYTTTVRIFDYEHHIFQYRRYPCQYFYTEDIQMDYNNETNNQCFYNTTTSDYRYKFRLQFDSRHVEPYILRNIAVQCKYINCSLSLLSMKYLRIDWNLQSRNNNINCSFDPVVHYPINANRNHTLSDWITLRCKSLIACNRSKHHLRQAVSSNIQLAYGSSYELDKPFCSLVQSFSYIIETNFAQTNRLLEQVVELLQRGFGKPSERKQAKMKEYVQQKWLKNPSTTAKNTVNALGQVQGAFNRPK